MSSGICAEDFVKKYGAENYRAISAAVESFPQDLYETDCRGIRLTKKGMRVANLIWAEII
jgi:oxygen-independent coproporphyrinogen-3 oxidase